MDNEDKKILMVVDSNALIHRAFHAIPGLVDPNGKLVNAVYGYCLILFRAIEDIKPDYIIATFDVKGKTFRHEEFAEYKAQRVKQTDNFYNQIPIVKDILKALNVLVLEKEGFEADDIIGTVSEKLSLDKNLETIIVTGDLDTLQLLKPNVKVWTLKTGISNSVMYDEKAFKNRYDLEIDQFVDYKALKGDPSDNIPGVEGIGDKTAIEILKKHGSLEKLYSKIDELLNDPLINAKDKKLYTKLKEHEDEADFSRHLALIKTDVEIDFNLEKAKFNFDNKKELSDIFKKLGFYSLINKLNVGVNSPKVKSVKNDQKVEEVDFNSFKNEEIKDLFVFDSKTMNVKEESLIVFWINGGVFKWFKVLNDEVGKFTKGLKGMNLITFDSKSIYHKYFEEFSDFDFFDLKIAYWLIDPDKKDYSVANLVKKFYREPEKSISFIENYEIEDWIKLFEGLYRNIFAKIVNLNLAKVLNEIERPLTKVLVLIEKNGIKLNSLYIKEMKDRIHLELLGLEEEIYALTGEKFNIKSPKQLGEILFEKLKISTKGLSKTTTKSVSTSSDDLEKILGSHEVVGKVIRFRELAKLENSFLDTLPTFIDEEKKIHTSLIQTGTATGRLSSDSPNLQNIPSKGDYGVLLRRAFVASDGYDMISFDYSQMELRIAATMSNDEKMLEAFRTGKDFHRFTASLVNGIGYDDVTSEQRSRAKALNFGIIYGMGSRAFAQSAKISLEDAKIFINDYFKNYNELKAYMDRLKNKAKEKGYCETLYGRKRFLPFIGSVGFQAALDERIAINMPVQGSAADIIKKAMIKIYLYLKENDLLNDVRMILQIHDELLLEVSQNLKNRDIILDKIDSILEENDFEILLKADRSVASNWGELKG